MAAGFKVGNEDEKKPEGDYTQLIGKYVRLWLSSGNALGMVRETSHRTITLLPHLVFIKYELTQEAYVEREIPSIISTDAIQNAQPIREGEKVLEKIIAETNEQNRINEYKREKESKK